MIQLPGDGRDEIDDLIRSRPDGTDTDVKHRAAVQAWLTTEIRLRCMMMQISRDIRGQFMLMSLAMLVFLGFLAALLWRQIAANQLGFPYWINCLILPYNANSVRESLQQALKSHRDMRRERGRIGAARVRLHLLRGEPSGHE